MFSYDEKSIFASKPCGTSPYHPPMTIPEKVERNSHELRETLERLMQFENTLKQKCEDLMSVLTSDNVTFKKMMEDGWSDFVSAVRTEVNIHETNTDAIIALFKKTVNANIDSFIQEVNNSADAMRLEIANAVTYMKTNLNASLGELLHQMEEDGELIGTIESDALVSVKKYGAVGDGVTDDTEAIQNAINACPNILIPDGAYKLTDTIYLKRDTNIKCSATAAFILSHGSVGFINAESDDSNYGYDGNSNITIDGGTVEFDTSVTAGRVGFVFGHAQNITIKNLTVLNAVGSHAFEFAGCKNVLVENCSFKGIVNPSNSYAEAIQIEAFNPAGFTYFGAFDYTPCENITVRGCYFGASASYPAPNVALGHHGAVYDAASSNISFVHNIVKGCTYAGVRAYYWNTVDISCNDFIDCNRAVMIDGSESAATTAGGTVNVPVGCTNVKVGYNRFIRCTPAVWMWGRENDVTKAMSVSEDVTITGNYAGECSMFIYGCSSNGVTIKHNAIYACSAAAIQFSNAKNHTISENTFRNNAAICVDVRDVTDRAYATQNVNINANKFEDCPDTCIKVRSVRNVVIGENTVFNCSGNSDAYPLFINNMVDGIIIRNNICNATAFKTNAYLRFLGALNDAAVIIGNVAKNYDDIDFTSADMTVVTNVNNVVVNG